MTDVKKQYINYRLSGSYSGLSAFMKNRKKWKIKDVVAAELRKLRGYALHVPARKHYPRRHVKVLFINETMAIDLKDISNISKANNGNHFILGLIDSFSKKAWCRPIKNKSADSVIKGLKSILREIKGSPVRFLWGMKEKSL